MLITLASPTHNVFTCVRCVYVYVVLIIGNMTAPKYSGEDEREGRESGFMEGSALASSPHANSSSDGNESNDDLMFEPNVPDVLYDEGMDDADESWVRDQIRMYFLHHCLYHLHCPINVCVCVCVRV